MDTRRPSSGCHITSEITGHANSLHNGTRSTSISEANKPPKAETTHQSSSHHSTLVRTETEVGYCELEVLGVGNGENDSLLQKAPQKKETRNSNTKGASGPLRVHFQNQSLEELSPPSPSSSLSQGRPLPAVSETVL